MNLAPTKYYHQTGRLLCQLVKETFLVPFLKPSWTNTLKLNLSHDGEDKSEFLRQNTAGFGKRKFWFRVS